VITNCYDTDVDNIEDDLEEFNESSTIVTLKNGIKIKRRKNHKILRYVRFNKSTGEEKYYRERLLLLMPWRNEVTDLKANYNTYKDHYEDKTARTDSKCEEYEHYVEALETARQMAENEHDDAFDELAPGSQQVEAETAEEEIVESEKIVFFNPDKVASQSYDIGIEIGASCSVLTVKPNANLLSEV